MRGLLVALVLCSTTLASAAEMSSRVAGWVHEAQRLYLKGDYRQAAALLLKAEQAEPDPRLVYNIARAYDQAGDLKLAVRYYQAYVDSPEGTDPLLLQRSGLALERLRGILAKEERLREQLQTERERHTEDNQAAAEQVRKAQDVTQAQAQARVDDESTHRAKLEAYSLGGLSAAALTGGVVLGILASSSKAEFTQAATVQDKQSLQSTTELRAGLADACYAVAIASAIGAYFVYPKDGAVTAALAPVPGGAVLAAGGRFP